MNYHPDEQHARLNDAELAELAAAMRTMSFQLWRGSEHTTEEHTLPKQQFWVLSALLRGPRKMSDLAGGCQTSQASLTGIVDRLEEHGYVCRKRSECDRRVVEVEATAEGLRVLMSASESFITGLRAVIEPLTDEERVEFLRLLRKMSSPTSSSNPRPLGGANPTC